MDIFTHKKKLKGYQRTKYIRVSKNTQDGEYQNSLLDEYYPGSLDSDVETCKGGTPFHERTTLPYLPSNNLVVSSHPDRILKTHSKTKVEDFFDHFLENNLVWTFPNSRALERSCLDLLTNPSESKYLGLVEDRFKEMIPQEVNDYPLKKYGREIVQKYYPRFINDRSGFENRSPGFNLLFTSAHVSKTINLIFEHRNFKARLLVDRTFGNEPQQILLAKALKDYEPRWSHIKSIVPRNYSDKTSVSLKELSSILAKNRGLVTKNGTHYLPTNLKKVIDSSNFQRFSDFVDHDFDPIVEWVSKPHTKIEFDWDLVNTCDPQFLMALQHFPYSKLYRDQRNVLRKLLRGVPSIYSTRTGGGKNDIPILYSYLRPSSFIVVVMPLRSLLDFYHSTLTKHYSAKEITIFHSSHNKKFSGYIRSIARGTARIALVTPDALQNEDSKLIDALADRGVDLLMIDECHHLLVSGKVRFRPVYQSSKIRKVLKQLNHPTTLFTSATINKEVYLEIEHVLQDHDHRVMVVKGELDRPNLKLFPLKFDNRGQKFLALYTLIKVFRNCRYRKGIIFFSSVSSLLKAHELLAGLGIETLIYFGKIHKDYPAKLKGENLHEFITSRDAIMLTTASFGEGISIPNIQFNIIFEHPGSDIELLQWAGRAGRNGKRAPVILMDDGHGRKIRQSLIESNRSVRGRKVQQELYDHFLDLLDRKPNLSFSDLLSRFQNT